MPENKLKVQSKKSKVEKTAKPVGLTVSMFNLAGKEAGVLDLPKEIFGSKVNKALLSQAIRVYVNNETAHFSNTKTRGEVKGSTRKIRQQKGTGGARHGGVRAPIFVGGGIALGPKSRKTELDLSKRMKKAALVSALADKYEGKGLVGVEGLEKVTGKTKDLLGLTKAMPKGKVLIVTGEKENLLERSAKNLPDLEVKTAGNLSILDLIRYQVLALTKEAVEKLESRIKNDESRKEEK